MVCSAYMYLRGALRESKWHVVHLRETGMRSAHGGAAQAIGWGVGRLASQLSWARGGRYCIGTKRDSRRARRGLVRTAPRPSGDCAAALVRACTGMACCVLCWSYSLIGAGFTARASPTLVCWLNRAGSSEPGALAPAATALPRVAATSSVYEL